MRTFQSPPVNEKLAGEIQIIKNWISLSDQPLYLEIGCGVGFHPIQFAKKNPQFRLLAFERTSEKYLKAKQRFIGNGSLENLLIVHGDASFFLAELFLKNTPAIKLAGIFVLYPNPYPKKSQSNLRLAHMPLTLVLDQILEAHGTLTLASNKIDYISEARKFIPAKTSLKILSSRQVETSANPRTHFEKKYLARGEECFELIFSKN
jgi:tRNA (guanine-N7-)-methyltransferase